MYFPIWKNGKQSIFIPVFKIKGKQNQTLFIDTDGNIYENWQDYLCKNHLPRCLYCYPRDGLYQGAETKVLIDFNTTPACDITSGILCIDNATTEVTFATSYMMTSLFSAPITTSMSELIQETLDCTDLDESEERMNWSLLIDMGLKMAKDRRFTSISQEAVAGNVEIKDQNIMQPVNIVVTVKDFYSLIGKASKKPTQGDVSYLTKYFLFYANQTFKLNDVFEIIKKTQEKVLNSYCDDLTEEQIDEFFKLSGKDMGKSQLHNNAKNIKAINHIPDKRVFFQSLVDAKTELESHDVQLSSYDLGLVNINNEIHIAPSKFVQISENDRQQILFATQNVKFVTDNAVYRKRLEKILNENRIKMEYQRRKALSLLKEAFHPENLKEVKIGNEPIFKNMTPSEFDRLSDVMKVFSTTYGSRVLKIANKFAEMLQCKTPRDYCNYVELTESYVSELKKQKEEEYQKNLNDAIDNKAFDRKKFDSDYGIKGKRAVHFRNEVIDYFDKNPEDSVSALIKRYVDLEKDVKTLNENVSPRFASTATGVCHYVKHCDFGSTKLTVEEYFKIASELVGEP